VDIRDLSAFRAYDIRGIYGETLTESMVERVGLAFANYLNSAAVVVGHDVRQSSPSLKKALLRGLIRGGSDVIDVGLVPTPFAYLASMEADVEGGVVVTASHNPPEWNGLKLFKKGGLLVAEGLGLEEVKDLYIKGPSLSEKEGRVVSGRTLLNSVKNLLLSKLGSKLRGKVAVDLGNGSCAPYAKELLVKAGLEVEPLNETPDGRFPSRGPEPREDNLQPLITAVIKRGCDYGVAYDGDGDRAVFVDDRGNVLPGDIILALFAKHYLIKHGKGKVIADVSCSMAVKEVVTKYGGELVVSRVGHAYLLNLMVRERALVGGEIASHFYFSEIGGIDDAIFATMKMAEVVAEAPISAQLDDIPRYPSTPVITYECQDEIKFSVIEKLAVRLSARGYAVDRLDGVKVYDQDGWVLVRASNTLPQIKLRAEARTQEKLRELIKLVEGELRQAMRT
jgi:phosphomannomutase